MSFWIAAFLLIPLADQAIKARLRQRLGDRVVSLGPLGSLRVIDAPIWWARGGCLTNFGLLAWTSPRRQQRNGAPV